jgi:hypothetical protein
MRKFVMAYLLAGMTAFAAADAAPLTVSVKDATTGDPVPDASVRIASVHLQATYNPTQARYSFGEVPVGTYEVIADSQERGVSRVKTVTLRAGVPASLEFVFPAASSIAGRVTDENGDPVSGISTLLVESSYRGGELIHSALSPVQTDDHGNYFFRGVPPGIAFRVLALKDIGTREALSAVPDDPKKRKPIPRPTYYPDSKTLESAEPEVVGVAEQRQGIDIRMASSQSYCMAGSVELDGPADSVSGRILLPQPGWITGTWTMQPGKFRFCDLAPGKYSLGAQSGKLTGFADLTIIGEDVTGIKLDLAGPQRVEIETAWDGDPPDSPPDSSIEVAFHPEGSLFSPVMLTRLPLPGHGYISLRAGPAIVSAAGLTKGLYAKALTADGISVQHGEMQVTGGIASTVRVVVARDGGFLNVLVVNHDGEPAPDTRVHIFPAEETAPAILAQVRATGFSGQSGSFSSGTLTPGNYYVLATNSKVDNTPEGIARLWEARKKAAKIEVTAGAAAQVTVETVTIE